MNAVSTVTTLGKHPGCVSSCPGCRYRNLTYEDSIDRKQAWLAQTLAAWLRQLAPVAEAPAGWRSHYRDRVTLHARYDGEWRFGLLHRDTLVPIPHCPVHHPRINRLVARLAAILPSPDHFPLAYLVCTGRQATLVLKSNDRPELGWLNRISLAALDLDALWLNLHPAAGRRLFAKRGWRRLLGSPLSRDDAGLDYGPEAFRQLVAPLHAASLERAQAYLAPGQGDAMLDLYCGLGAGLRRWQDAGARVLGVELGGEAVTCARRNAPAATVLRGACATRLPQIQFWLAAQAGRVLAYVNPPRTGLEAPLRDWLCDAARPVRMAYLSCSAGTLARDLGQLEAAGYNVDTLQPYDFFPGTLHVETLALLSRRAAATA